MEGIGYGKQELLKLIIKRHWGVEPTHKSFTWNELLFVIQEMTYDEGRGYFEDSVSDISPISVYKNFVQYLLYRNLANYDSMVLISSEKGTGKSSAAIILAREWCRIIGIKFDPNRHIAYTNADVVNKIEQLNKFEPLIADEAVNFASTSDWALRQNKYLRKKLAQIRTKHLLFILCFPMKIYKLEKTYLESFVNYWCMGRETKILIEDKNGMKRNYPIGELRFKKNYKVATYNLSTNEIEYVVPEKCIKTHKEAEVYEIELENGQKITATKDHPFLTTNGYKRLEELTENDEIIVRTKACPTCKEEFIPKKESMKYCCEKCKENSEYYREQNKQNIKNWRQRNSEKDKISHHNSYLKKREDRLKKAKEYREKYRDEINKWAEEYRKNNVELLRQRDKKYRENNYEQYIKKSREKYLKGRQNINVKLSTIYRNRLRAALLVKKAYKPNPALTYLGCSIEELRNYLEKQFKPGMSWKNHTKDGWHIDHKIPCAIFDLTKEEERQICFHYTNLQPLWAIENLSKNDKYESNKN